MKFLKILFLTNLVFMLILTYKSFADKTDTLSDTLTVKYKAEKEAEKDVNKACWFGAGLGFNIIGTVAAIAMPPSPDPGQFAGKTPEYIRMYTDAYKSRGKEIQTTYSIMGCMTAVAVSACVTIYLVNEATNDCVGCMEYAAEDESGSCSDCSSAPPE